MHDPTPTQTAPEAVRTGKRPRARSVAPGPSGRAPLDAAAVLERVAALEGEGRAAEALLLLLGESAAREPAPGILTALADRLHARGRLGPAIEAYGRALALEPACVQAWWGQACAQAAQGDHPGAVSSFRRLLALCPGHGGALTNLGRSLFALGDVDAALESFRAALPHLDHDARAVPLLNIAMSIPGAPQATHADVLRARRRWAAYVRPGPPLAPLPERAPRAGPERALRLGYVSSFFDSGNWMKPVWPLLARHDRERFELHVFAPGRPAATSGFPADPRDRFHDIAPLSNEALARRVRDLGIDVLVDLNGFSDPLRLPLFLLRPAPVQVAWFNLFAPSGLDGAFDCLLGDAHVIPAAEERWYPERVRRVDGTYLPFAVTYPVPEVAPAPCAAGRPLTFGCLAPLYKITPAMIGRWSRLLAASPGTRLLLKNERLGHPSVRAHVRAQFAAAGLGPDRLALDGPAEHADFLRGYERIDVALDTSPYNGGTTTTEALWQGVPVLTFPGDRWAGRISTSLLRAAGLDEWVANDAEDYVARAVRLAADPLAPARLAELRRTMRARLQASPACDVGGFARRLEGLYLELLGRA